MERRKDRRFRGEDGAFVSVSPCDNKFWQIIDISRGGLSFRYIPQAVDLDKASELDLITRDALFSLEKIPFKSVSDCEIADQCPSNYQVKRHGVQFGELMDNQISQLEYFIQKNTVAEL